MVPDFEECPRTRLDPAPFGYSRISSDGSSQPDSVADQLEDIRRCAAEHGLDIVAVYSDEHRGSVSKTLARFADMLDEAQHRAGAMLLWFSSRLKGR